MSDGVDKILLLSPCAWRWLWVFVIICCSVGIGSLLVSDRFTWWDFLVPSAAIAVGASALIARRVFGFVLILFAIAVTTQLIHEFVTFLMSR